VEPYQFQREPLEKGQLESALPKGYLPLFYEYVDELDFYFLDRKKLLLGNRFEEFVCFINDTRYNSRKSPNIYVYKEPNMSEQEALDYSACLAHEVGHAIDKANGYVSKTEEFQKAVELSIEMLENDRSGPCSWCFVTEQVIAPFSGINGNPLSAISTDEWGGYAELYAQLFEYGFSLDEIPPPLRIFYQDYLP